MKREEPSIGESWERYKKKMDNWPMGYLGEAIGKTFIFFLWMAFMGFLVEINIHPILGGLVFWGGFIVIVKEMGGFD